MPKSLKTKRREHSLPQLPCALWRYCPVVKNKKHNVNWRQKLHKVCIWFTLRNNNLGCKRCQHCWANNLKLHSRKDKLNFPYTEGNNSFLTKWILMWTFISTMSTESCEGMRTPHACYSSDQTFWSNTQSSLSKWIASHLRTDAHR